MNATMTASTVAIAKAVTKAAPNATIVAKTSRTAYTAVSAFHMELFNAAFKSANLLNKAVKSQRTVMRNLLTSQYGTTCPTFSQFKADRTVLRVMALERGLVDDQWVRKPYCAAVIDLYGALPVSDSPAAIAKRAQRPVAVKAAPGAKKGETSERAPAIAETIEQFIAKHGVAKVMDEIARILATKRETALDAKTLQAVAKKYA